MGEVMAVGFAGLIGAILAIFVGYFALIGAAGRGQFSNDQVTTFIRKQLLWCASAGAIAGALWEFAHQLD